MTGFSLKNNEISYNSSSEIDELTINNTGVLNIKPTQTGNVRFTNKNINQVSFAQQSADVGISPNLVLPGRLVFGLDKRMFFDTTEQRARGLHSETSLQTVTTGFGSTTATNVAVWLSPVVTYTPRFSNSIVLFEAIIVAENYNRGTDDDFAANVSVDEVDVNGTTILRAGARYLHNSTSSNSRNIGYSNAFQAAIDANHGLFRFINTRAVPAVRSSDGLVRVRGGGIIANDTTVGFGAYLDMAALTVSFQEFI